MLRQLQIEDFAIIDQASVDFAPGFTVVTGETGAGKSILIDALMVALGARAGSSVVRQGAECARVEALFDIANHLVVQERLQERSLAGDDPNTLVVYRTVAAKGRGRVVINGRLSTVATLVEIVRGLVEISGQHAQQSLLVEDQHGDILDRYGDLLALRTAYGAAYERWRSAVRRLETLGRDSAAQEQQIEFWRFQLQDLERLGAVPDEDQVLAEECKRLRGAERLRQGALLAESLLYGDDGSAFDRLGKAASEVASMAEVDAQLAPVAAALAGARGEVEEAARSLQRYGARVEGDPERLAEVEDRLQELQRAIRKYGGSLAALLERRDTLEQKLADCDDGDGALARAEAEAEACLTEVERLGTQLREARVRASGDFSAAVEAELADMELAGARLVARASTCAWGAAGGDRVDFWWSANPGEAPRPLTKIASGGELSRVMLAVKRVLSHHDDLVSVYVFDEVDTGLGGKAADAIGRKIQSVAQGHQAITITHLAPIAARADQHLRVHKRRRGKRTVSVLEWVTGKARATEVARMIDGGKAGEPAQQAAAAMLSG